MPSGADEVGEGTRHMHKPPPRRGPNYAMMTPILWIPATLTSRLLLRRWVSTQNANRVLGAMTTMALSHAGYMMVRDTIHYVPPVPPK
ncbi:hypothetical protein TrLO_g5199 [Triparma laevis f. longispina]|uniref:Uncharacterized protein n=1 Tax=Triparma laevis f. longispina TaxID=1714387 RepID=A0A9W7E4N0_9STRA|nr:hypothetical protein TrLO_g5199 [Triparma laevis f. longispina]